MSLRMNLPIILINHIGQHGLVMGDMNSHHSSWEPSKGESNFSGRSLFAALSASSDLVLLNPPDSSTRQDPATGVVSNLDLFIGTRYFHPYKFTVEKDLGSDHFPVTLTSTKQGKPRLFFRPRWAIKQATESQWDEWSSQLVKASIPRCDNTQIASQNFEKAIITCSNNHFKINSSASPKRPGNVWWNQKCAAAVSARRNAKKAFRKFPTPTNKTNLNRLTQRAKTIIEEAKRVSIGAYVSKLDHRTPSAVVWKMFRAVSGRPPPPTFPLSSGTVPLTTGGSAEALAAHFSLSFAQHHVLPETEINYLEESFMCDSEIGINQRFSLQELRSAILQLPAQSATGEDLVHNNKL